MREVAAMRAVTTVTAAAARAATKIPPAPPTKLLLLQVLLLDVAVVLGPGQGGQLFLGPTTAATIPSQ
jgi:hypothetical protein